MTATEKVNVYLQVNAEPQHHFFVSLLLFTVITIESSVRNIQSTAKVSLSLGTKPPTAYSWPCMCPSIDLRPDLSSDFSVWSLCADQKNVLSVDWWLQELFITVVTTRMSITGDAFSFLLLWFLEQTPSRERWTCLVIWTSLSTTLALTMRRTGRRPLRSTW